MDDFRLGIRDPSAEPHSLYTSAQHRKSQCKRKLQRQPTRSAWLLAQGDDIIHSRHQRRKYLEENFAALEVSLDARGICDVSKGSPAWRCLRPSLSRSHDEARQPLVCV